MCLICAVSAGSHSTTSDPLPLVARAPRLLLILLIGIYRRFVSPWSPPSCRFTPTCSRYAIDSLRRYGALAGSWLAVWRVLRCNPLHRGGYDPLR